MALTEADLALLALGAQLEVRPTGRGMQIRKLRLTGDWMSQVLTRPEPRYGDGPGQYRMLAVGLHPGRPTWVEVKPIVQGEVQQETWWVTPKGLAAVR